LICHPPIATIDIEVLGTIFEENAQGFGFCFSDQRHEWAIPAAPDPADPDEWDWEQLFGLLENEVVPGFYDRDEAGVPKAWVRRMKQALWVAGRRFTTDRMLRDYADRYYLPALAGGPQKDDPPTG
jgi:glucan phosphorylase